VAPPVPCLEMNPATLEHVISRVSCAHCRGAIELECEGLTGFFGYRTYNEYFCPHCRKQNHALSTGAVLSARVPADSAPVLGRGARVP
jgi:Zn finger protein HypA/HybF involved in hydrogenase expression